MNERDIDIYLRAKHQQKLARLVAIAAIFLTIFYIALRIIGVDFQYMDAIFGGLVIGALSFNFGSWSNVSNRDLLSLIERQINKDPKAIEILSRKCA